jgi:dTDP-4-amino-4,6-dideoxygalactose transaminase
MTINVTRSSMPPFDEYIAEIGELWDTHWLTNSGVKHRTLEAKLKEYLDVEGLCLFCNGHLALELCLQAFKLTGEVITTPFTFVSTTHAIARNGLIPVFCDIRGDDYTLDADKLESLITEKTSAIVPVHVYGNICGTTKIEAVARKHNLKVIYDAAHAFGVKMNGVSAGTFGDASMFSFHATKVFNTIEGGAVCYSAPEIGRRMNCLKNFGIKNEDMVEFIGGNAKMNEFAAAMGICNLRHIDEEISKRRQVFELYQELLADVQGLTLPTLQDGITPNYAYFPILIDETHFGRSRDALQERLKETGINSRKYFYPLTSSFDCYKEQAKSHPTPIAERISKQVLTLPIYADLALHDAERICDYIMKGI